MPSPPMIFSSLQYLIFLPFVVLLYWRTTGGARLALVILASYFFYMSWLPVYGLLLFTLTTVNWLIGLALSWAQQRSPVWKNALFALGLTVNLGCLCYYKYTEFVLSNLAAAFHWGREHLGLFAGAPPWDAPVLSIILPLGISFFVFEFVHYIVDVYKGDRPVSSWMEFAAFASFFPSQIAGPIKRYQDFIQRLRAPERWSGGLFREGMALIVQGLFKKVAIADPLGSVTYLGFASAHTLTCPDALISSVGFWIQVYCDFSGYTDIGRGSALLMGIRLPENFNLPYLAGDLSEMWRRWHMSLSFWLRDYVYIPLGGSLKGRLVTWRNLLVTMVACGVWHGGAWHYVVFGIMQGLGLIVNREWRTFLNSVPRLKAYADTWLARQLGWLLTVAFVILSWTVFRAPDMGHAGNVIVGLANFKAASDLALPLLKAGIIQFAAVYAGFWLLTDFLKRGDRTIPGLWSPVVGFTGPVRAAAWTAAVILMIAAKPTEATPFVYFQF